MRVAFWLGCLLVACGGGDDPADSDSDVDVGGCQSTDGVSPYIISSTLSCPPPVGETRFIQVEVTADDPQGAFTIAPSGHKLIGYIVANGQELFSEPGIACDRNNAGQCLGSANAGAVGVDCGALANYRFSAIIIDDDGNESPECDFPPAE